MNNYFSGLPFFPDSPFKNNTNITKVKISHGVTSIGNEAFSECEALTSIEIPNLVTSIGWSAFDGCEALEFNEYGKELYLGNKENPYAFLIKTKSTDITACSIKDTCKIIGYRAFSRCEALTSIKIPNSVTSIGDSAFLGCEALTSIHIRCEHPENLKIYEEAFYKTNINNCTLHVPKWTENAYRQHPAFRKFKKIKVKHDNFIEFIMYLIIGKYI